jgi:hypothetical protein
MTQDTTPTERALRDAAMLREAVLEMRYVRGRLDKVTVEDYAETLRILGLATLDAERAARAPEGGEAAAQRVIDRLDRATRGSPDAATLVKWTRDDLNLLLRAAWFDWTQKARAALEAHGEPPECDGHCGYAPDHPIHQRVVR